MYNRYVPGSGGYTRVVVEEELSKERAKREERTDHGGQRQSSRARTDSGQQDILKNLTASLGLFGREDKNAGMAGILRSLHLDDLDSGDILLLLIMLFVFMEGDNVELVITLGLMLLFGLGGEGKECQKE